MRIRASSISILLGIFLCACSLSFAQEAETTEPPPSFLEVVLEGRDLTINPSWTWTPIAKRNKAFLIEIVSPSTWASAHLCVDGHAMKEIKAGENSFKWSFARLKPGSHTVTLVVIDSEGNAGTVSRELN